MCFNYNTITVLLFPYLRKGSAVIITMFVDAENNDDDDVIMSSSSSCSKRCKGGSVSSDTERPVHPRELPALLQHEWGYASCSYHHSRWDRKPHRP